MCTRITIFTISLYLISPSDVFSQGIWPGLLDIKDPELKNLAESLPSIVLQSKARVTVKKYSVAFSRWKRWAVTKPNIDVFPAKPFQVALYLSYLVKTAKTSASIEDIGADFT